MATKSVLVSNLNIGGNTPTSVADVKVRPAGTNLKNVKEIAIISGTNDFGIGFNSDFYVGVINVTRVFDRQTYTLNTGEEVQFTAQGGTIDASSQITSTLTHGDGVSENVAYTGNPVITVGPNILPRERTGSVTIRQGASNLTALLYWRQAAPE